jgi:hypothetical protein
VSSQQPRAFRLRQSARAALRRERKSALNTLNDTESLHHIIDRGELDETGKFNGIKVYLVGALACKRELEYFAVRLDKILAALARVESRLAGPLNPATLQDPKRQASVETWRKLADELPEVITAIIETAQQLALWMNSGVSHKHYDSLRNIQQVYRQNLSREEADILANGDAHPDRIEALSHLKNAIFLIEILLGTAQNPMPKPRGLGEEESNEVDLADSGTDLS